MYKAAGMESFQASPPKHSFQMSRRDHGLFSRILSLMTTPVQTINLRISFMNTAVEVKYRAPSTAGITRE